MLSIRIFCRRTMRWNRRQLTWLLTANLGILGIVLLVAYDSNMLLGLSGRSQYHAAYNRWKHIRTNFDTYNKDRAKKDDHIRHKNMQLDQIVGFDDIHPDSKKKDAKLVKDVTYNVMGPLDFIPPVPESSDSDIVPLLTKRLTDKYLKLPNMTYSNKIAILTPICNVADALERFTSLLSRLTYPHDLISVYFGEDSSDDRSFDLATLIASDLKEKYKFKDSAAFHFNISGGVHGTWGDVHYRTSQLKRRAHLAKARNMLLNVGLHAGKFDYILWIDSDITELPEDIVQQLLYAKTDVVTATCLYRSSVYRKIFDKNSWRETPTSIEDQKSIPNDVLLVEGYTHTFRIYLSHLRADGRVVPIDGVGGCALMIRTECHRQGLKFPEKVYKHHIETEGLAKMATDMGYRVMGMPFVEVFH